MTASQGQFPRPTFSQQPYPNDSFFPASDSWNRYLTEVNEAYGALLGLCDLVDQLQQNRPEIAYIRTLNDAEANAGWEDWCVQTIGLNLRAEACVASLRAVGRDMAQNSPPIDEVEPHVVAAAQANYDWLEGFRNSLVEYAEKELGPTASSIFRYAMLDGIDTREKSVSVRLMGIRHLSGLIFGGGLQGVVYEDSFKGKYQTLKNSKPDAGSHEFERWGASAEALKEAIINNLQERTFAGRVMGLTLARQNELNYISDEYRMCTCAGYLRNQLSQLGGLVLELLEYKAASEHSGYSGSVTSHSSWGRNISQWIDSLVDPADTVRCENLAAELSRHNPFTDRD